MRVICSSKSSSFSSTESENEEPKEPPKEAKVGSSSSESNIGKGVSAWPMSHGAI